MPTLATLATLTAAQTRIDDGHPQPGDHNCAQRLSVLLEAGAERLRTLTAAHDLDSWERQHAQACDGGDDCKHYEPREG